MISADNLNKILTIVKHAHFIDSSFTVQPYHPDYPYRTGILVTVIKGRVIDYCYVNIEKKKLTPWKLKTWNKRKKEIPLESFQVECKNPDIIRFGFR